MRPHWNLEFPEGPLETTTLIGGVCKRCEALSLPVLIAREAWPPNAQWALPAARRAQVQFPKPNVRRGPGPRRARLLGDNGGRAPPGPIPNPEVKPPSADDSAAVCRAKVGNRQAPYPTAQAP